MSTQITKHHLSEIRAKLPHRYVEELTRRVNEKLPAGSKPVKASTVEAVMGGHRKDYYNIIQTAIEWANELEKEPTQLLEKAGIKKAV